MEPELIAKGLLSEFNYIAVINASTLVPDMDGDGMEDVVLSHARTDTLNGSEVRTPYVDLFLTTHMTPVSVLEEPVPIQGPRPCVWSGAEALIYNALGEQIAVLPVQRSTLAPSDIEALPMQPLWGVVGDCVKRVR